MNNELDMNKVLKFLENYKTRKEIEKEFNLSNTRSFNLLRWLKKAKIIKSMHIRVSGKTNRVWYYKLIKPKTS